MLNAVESRIVPTTNNAVEQLIRICTQHDKTFCGFEKVYRFTSLYDDAQERVRGRCPLELAGYQVQKLPMTQLFRGLALQWPASNFQDLVPGG